MDCLHLDDEVFNVPLECSQGNGSTLQNYMKLSQAKMNLQFAGLINQCQSRCRDSSPSGTTRRENAFGYKLQSARHRLKAGLQTHPTFHAARGYHRCLTHFLEFKRTAGAKL